MIEYNSQITAISIDFNKQTMSVGGMKELTRVADKLTDVREIELN